MFRRFQQSTKRRNGVIRNRVQRCCVPEFLEARYCLATFAFVETDRPSAPMDIARILHVIVGDIDTDGAPDLIVGGSSEDGLYLTELLVNNGQGSFRHREALPFFESSHNYVARSQLVDFDNDGDLDFYEHQDEAALLWTNDGTGYFERNDHFESLGQLAFGDLDADGDVDIAHVHHGLKIRSNDGFGNFRLEQETPNSNLRDSYGTAIGDINGDGLPDVYTVGSGPSEAPVMPDVIWLGQEDGTFVGVESTANVEGAVALVDLDGDGDLDIVGDLTAWQGAGFEVAIWLNDGSGHFVQITDRLEGNLPGPNNQLRYLADVDGDRDLDILLYSSDNHVLWRNDSSAYFEQVSFPAEAIESTDFDGDGDRDLLLWERGKSQLIAYESRLIGDSNNDGVFNSSDFVAVFTAGNYERRGPEPVSFNDGDWNQDGEFNSADLVIAFKSGNYATNARARPALDVAAADLAFAVQAMLANERNESAFRTTLTGPSTVNNQLESH